VTNKWRRFSTPPLFIYHDCSVTGAILAQGDIWRQTGGAK